MQNKNSSINVTKNYIAKILGIPSETIKELVNKKILKPDVRGNYNLSESLDSYSDYKQGLKKLKNK